jgi:hypothetical protein
MSGAIPPLPHYTFMAWCSVKAQEQLYLLPLFTDGASKWATTVSSIPMYRSHSPSHIIRHYIIFGIGSASLNKVRTNELCEQSSLEVVRAAYAQVYETDVGQYLDIVHYILFYSRS